MRVRVVCLVVALLGLTGETHAIQAQTPNDASHHSATMVVRRALAAIGGEERWRAVRTLELRGRSVVNHVGDSDWPEGPYIRTFADFDDWRDLVGHRRSVRTTQYVEMDTGRFSFRTVTTLRWATQFADANGREIGRPVAPDTLALMTTPERVLWTALDAADLRLGHDTTLRFATHQVVSFHVGATLVRVSFEKETGFPRMVEARRAFPSDVFWNAWGDVVERIRYTNWTREAGGVVYPRQVDVERNGRPYSTFAYGVVDVNALPPDRIFDPDTMPPSPTACGFGCLLADSLPLGVGGAGGVGANATGRGAREISPGVIQIVGGWNATLVRQSDGVVVIEAPISPGYSRRVLDEAARRFAGVPVVGVVTTTDYWWHVAGLREYIARGIPIYVLDRNVRLVDARARSPHTLVPDSLARAPRAPIIKAVTRRTVVGFGENRLELIPIRTEGLDRMMMVYLPGRHLLYTAEGIQLYPSGLSYPQSAIEVVAAAQREGLTPERFIGMHVAATPWSRLTAILDSLNATY